MSSNKELLAALQQAFPQLFSKCEDDGVTREKLDLEKIRLLAGNGNYSDKYGLRWEDKPEQFDADTVGKVPALTRVADKAINSNPAKPTHVLIQGDNYHALKVLAYTHERAVDVIYIDPPYNTGHQDFKYNDRFVDKEDGYRHSKWLSFMAKRLKLAKSLLKVTGAIFISIDDNEQASLKLLCDEIFGQENFIANLVLKKGRGSQDATHLKIVHEYALLYAKDKSRLRIARNQRVRKSTTSVSLRKTGEGDRKADAPALHYPIYADPSSGRLDLEPFDNAVEILPIGPGGYLSRWRWSKEKFKRDKALLTVAKTKKGTWDLKSRYAEGSTAVEPFNALLTELGSPGGSQLNDIVPGNAFKNPKHTNFIEHLLTMVGGGNSVVLDFFAGSGTTAHAVMRLNAEDGGRRQCILITNDEGEFKNEAGTILPGGICTNVTYPRLKKVIEGYTTPNGKVVAGLGENLEFFQTAFQLAPESRDQLRDFVRFCSSMLCLKANAYSAIEESEQWGLFDGQGKHLFMLFDEYAANEAVRRLKNIDGPVEAYVFAYERDDDSAEILSQLPNVTVQEVPQPLLDLFFRTK